MKFYRSESNSRWGCENCQPHKCKPSNPECDLFLPAILQCVEDHKIQNFLKVLAVLHMKVDMIGKNDFQIVGA